VFPRDENRTIQAFAKANGVKPALFSARSATLIVATPLGTAIGGSLVAALGAVQTLTASGAATILLAALAAATCVEGAVRLRRLGRAAEGPLSSTGPGELESTAHPSIASCGTDERK
jgi:hypothetical protein